MTTRVALLATPELMFQSRLREFLERLGLAVLVGDNAAAITTGLSRRPSVLILDLQSVVDPAEMIRLARQAGVPVLAYGQHTKANVLRLAREAGATMAVTRSQLVEDLPVLVDRALKATIVPAADPP